MNAQGVKIFHIAHSDTIVVCISDHFVLNFFPAFHASLDQYLWTCSKGLAAQFHKLLLVVGKPASKSTKGICSSNNDRVAYAIDDAHGLFNGGSGRGLGTLLANRLHASGKQLAVFSRDDGINWCSKHFDT